mmetsp:Transcript_42214/g.47009  ORF Transcript_42214/g.47009 Transcript_42214/m.47009 type:complete len:92 (+) Transcript_42214:529-804(+)
MEEEPWYGTNYVTIAPNEGVMQIWKTSKHQDYPQLQLPEVNDMVPTDFSLLTTTSTTTPPPINHNAFTKMRIYARLSGTNLILSLTYGESQ